MAYDERLADRVRAALDERATITERKMFGGLAFMLDGNMCCGVHGDELIARLGPEGADAALERPHVRPMDLTGRPLTGFVFVEGAALRSDEDLREWVDRAAGFAASLPPK